jgi:hypothetical protein
MACHPPFLRSTQTGAGSGFLELIILLEKTIHGQPATDNIQYYFSNLTLICKLNIFIAPREFII